MVGSSIAMRGRGSGLRTSAIVSPISKLSSPTMAQISPEPTEDTLLRPIPSKTSSSLMRCFTNDPSFLHKATSIPSRSSPRCTRPIAIRPT